MPKLNSRQKVLEGRAEVVSYTNRPDRYYIRVYDPPRRYRSRLIDASTEEDAISKCLDAYIELTSGSKQVSDSKRSGDGDPVRQKQLNQLINDFLSKDQERVSARDLDERHARNRKDIMLNHLKPYLQLKSVTTSDDIKLGVFDDYKLYRPDITKHTLRTELSVIKFWLKWLHRHDHLPLKTSLHLDELVILPTLKDTDLQGNPPFNEEDWLVFNKEVQRWVKEMEKNMPGQSYHNPRIYHWRYMVWTLIMVLKTSGMRPKEAFNIKWNDVVFEKLPRTR